MPKVETYGRITAVLVNSDPSQSGFNNGKQDWNFTKDNENFSGVRVVSGAPPNAPVVSTNAATGVAGSVAQAFSVAVSGLTRGTTHHYRVVAQNASGTATGSDSTFTTLDPPIVSTAAATNLAADGAT